MINLGHWSYKSVLKVIILGLALFLLFLYFGNFISPLLFHNVIFKEFIIVKKQIIESDKSFTNNELGEFETNIKITTTPTIKTILPRVIFVIEETQVLSTKKSSDNLNKVLDNSDTVNVTKLHKTIDLPITHTDEVSDLSNVIEDDISVTIQKSNLELVEISNFEKLPEYKSPWTWSCQNDKCQRTRRNFSSHGIGYKSLDNCWLTCGVTSSLWPKPRWWRLGYKTITFDISNFLLETVMARSPRVKRLTTKAFTLLKRNLKLLVPSEYKTKSSNDTVIYVNLQIKSPDVILTITTNESYTLRIKRHINSIGGKKQTVLKVFISGRTFFGVRHGLETLSQLIVFDDSVNALQTLSSVMINDKPAFAYRGLMIDSARNFIPIGSLERMIDGMSYNKLNMLHWHLSDSNSFPFFSRTYPQMTHYGAYSKKEIYTPNQVRNLVEYALVRGIKIIPELDAPAHAGNGWQWGPETEVYGQLAFCINEEPWNTLCGQPPCGQLNPANPKVYEVLGGLYRDMFSVFDLDLFHMGGDEVMFECWKKLEIENFMEEKNITNFINLRAYFQATAYEKLKEASRNIKSKSSQKYFSKSNFPPIPIIWSSDLTNHIKTLVDNGINSTDYFIQVWEGTPLESEEVQNLIDSNYTLIVSNMGKVYLDLGSGSWLGKNHDLRYINWQSLYDFNFDVNGYNTSKIVENARFGRIPQILGGEAPLWTEKVNEMTMDSKLWPRGSAFAERLWTNPTVKSSSPIVYSRLLRQNELMKMRGIRVDTRQPKSCLLIGTVCLNDFDVNPSPPIEES